MPTTAIISTAGYGRVIDLAASQGQGCKAELIRKAIADHGTPPPLLIETRLIPFSHPDSADGDYVIVAELRYHHPDGPGGYAHAIYGLRFDGTWTCFAD